MELAPAGMRRELRRHPDWRSDAVAHIEVDIARPRADLLLLTYAVTGIITDLRLPPVTAPARTDELWRHTCFEAFIRPDPGAAYFELNFAPSTQWAAYRFDGYRSGMRDATEIGSPRIEVQSAPDRYALQATIQTGALNMPCRLGLTAVIEETNGNKSYWALAHPAGKPDFHHADGFACEIP
jgi:hypothetical protein